MLFMLIARLGRINKPYDCKMPIIKPLMLKIKGVIIIMRVIFTVSNCKSGELSGSKIKRTRGSANIATKIPKIPAASDVSVMTALANCHASTSLSSRRFAYIGMKDEPNAPPATKTKIISGICCAA